jgi:hypothetical protein
MTDHLKLIRVKLQHLSRMREYLAYSLSQVEPVLPLTDWATLSPDQHESLAAFRVRFSEFQEHLGKAMRAVAIEEEQEVERFGSVLAFMERLQVIDSADHWKLVRELRNAAYHEYEDDGPRLAEFFALMAKETATLFGYFSRLEAHCVSAYGIAP